jgi:hypothetical protein
VAYEGLPEPALRALLGLLPPHHPDAPASPFPALPGLHIPRAAQGRLTIALPVGRAGHCAARLAAPMAATREGAHSSATGDGWLAGSICRPGKAGCRRLTQGQR